MCILAAFDDSNRDMGWVDFLLDSWKWLLPWFFIFIMAYVLTTNALFLIALIVSRAVKAFLEVLTP